MTYEITITSPEGSTKTHKVELSCNSENGGYLCRVDGEPVEFDSSMPEPDLISILLDGTSYEVRRDNASSGQQVSIGGVRFGIEIRDPRSLQARQRRDGVSDGPRRITAPMPGKVVRILVTEGSEVEVGQSAIVIEAMKMQNELKSPKKGVIKKILVAEGVTVNAGDNLVIVE